MLTEKLSRYKEKKLQMFVKKKNSYVELNCYRVCQNFNNDREDAPHPARRNI